MKFQRLNYMTRKLIHRLDGMKLPENSVVLNLIQEKARLFALTTFLVLRNGQCKLGRSECTGCSELC